MERNELDSQLTWDLRFLFESQTAFEAQLADAEKELKQLCASLQELAVDKAHFISFMEHQETLERYLDNLISYAKMSCDVVSEEHAESGKSGKQLYPVPAGTKSAVLSAAASD